jgi:hypothetical protein
MEELHTRFLSVSSSPCEAASDPCASAGALSICEILERDLLDSLHQGDGATQEIATPTVRCCNRILADWQ